MNIRRMGSQFAREEGGQALVLGAIMFMALLFAVGLAIDTGQLYAAKRTQQEAADAAAFAGAVVFYQGGTATEARAAATADATRNGYTDGLANTTVTVSSPPTSGTYNGDVKHVEVTIIRTIQTALVPAQALFNPVRARGVAGAETFNNGYAIMALDATCTPGALNVNSNENIHVAGGGIIVNSCAANAVTGFSSSQDLQIASPYSLNTAGGTTGNTFPVGVAVSTGVSPVPDPFAGFPKPSTVGLLTNPSSGYGGTLFQGVYTGSLDSSALCHGIYILKGGGMGGDITRDTNVAHIDPNTGLPCDGRVLIFNTNSNYPSSGGSCTGIGRSGNHPITLRPMTTGTYTNMQIYQDPACTATLDIGGTQTLDADGTIYLPNATISMNGNPSTLVSGQLIAKRLDIQNGNLNITYSTGNTAQPILPRLAE
jgi:Flp pilus assembly protein TadG